ncbi:unnamed protein product [Lota lota]
MYGYKEVGRVSVNSAALHKAMAESCSTLSQDLYLHPLKSPPPPGDTRKRWTSESLWGSAWGLVSLFDQRRNTASSPESPSTPNTLPRVEDKLIPKAQRDLVLSSPPASQQALLQTAVIRRSAGGGFAGEELPRIDQNTFPDVTVNIKLKAGEGKGASESSGGRQILSLPIGRHPGSGAEPIKFPHGVGTGQLDPLMSSTPPPAVSSIHRHGDDIWSFHTLTLLKNQVELVLLKNQVELVLLKNQVELVLLKNQVELVLLKNQVELVLLKNQVELVLHTLRGSSSSCFPLKPF